MVALAAMGVAAQLHLVARTTACESDDGRSGGAVGELGSIMMEGVVA